MISLVVVSMVAAAASSPAFLMGLMPCSTFFRNNVFTWYCISIAPKVIIITQCITFVTCYFQLLLYNNRTLNSSMQENFCQNSSSRHLMDRQRLTVHGPSISVICQPVGIQYQYCTSLPYYTHRVMAKQRAR